MTGWVQVFLLSKDAWICLSDVIVKIFIGYVGRRCRVGWLWFMQLGGSCSLMHMEAALVWSACHQTGSQLVSASWIFHEGFAAIPGVRIQLQLSPTQPAEHAHPHAPPQSVSESSATSRAAFVCGARWKFHFHNDEINLCRKIMAALHFPSGFQRRRLIPAPLPDTSSLGRKVGGQWLDLPLLGGALKEPFEIKVYEIDDVERLQRRKEAGSEVRPTPSLCETLRRRVYS